MSERFEVAIVGGGVAGSSLGAVLARAGRSVVVIEREARFRDRIRGESIHPWGVAEIYSLGLESLLNGAKQLPIWQRYIDRVPELPFEWADVSIGGRPEVSISHPALQDAAINEARAAGATILRPAEVVELRLGAEPELDLITSEGPRTITARLVAGADGKSSTVRRRAGIKSKRDPIHHRIGGALFSGVTLDERAAHEATFEGGRVFTLPQGGSRVRSYIVTASDMHLDVQRDRSGDSAIEFLAALYPDGTWQRAQRAGPIAFFPNADHWAERLTADGIVLIGDAAGANDPSVGNGLSLALRDVRELRDLLVDGDDWPRATAEFANRRERYFDMVRRHAHWIAMLVTEVGLEADQRRERVERAREDDPTAGGFTLIFARGPDGLVADEAARRRFFGEAV